MLNKIDEYTEECLVINIWRKITVGDFVDISAHLFIERSTPKFIRSDNGPKFAAELFKQCLQDLGKLMAYIESGSSWENSYIESFNENLEMNFFTVKSLYTIYQIHNTLKFNTSKDKAKFIYQLKIVYTAPTE